MEILSAVTFFENEFQTYLELIYHLVDKTSSHSGALFFEWRECDNAQITVNNSNCTYFAVIKQLAQFKCDHRI